MKIEQVFSAMEILFSNDDLDIDPSVVKLMGFEPFESTNQACVYKRLAMSVMRQFVEEVYNPVFHTKTESEIVLVNKK